LFGPRSDAVVTGNRGSHRIVPSDALFSFSNAEQIVGMPAQVAPPRRWTLDEFYRERDAAPAGDRWELVDGEVLVTPSPHWSHQRTDFQLGMLLAAYVRSQRIGEVFLPPLDVLLEPKLVLQPDILVVPNGLLLKRSDVVSRLLLAVEILSPSSARHDRIRKRPVYQRNRVPEYWVVDDQSRSVERWRPDDKRSELISAVLEWHPDGATEPFVLDLPEFFAEVVPPDK
jgi:Uma2 family endonuclease